MSGRQQKAKRARDRKAYVRRFLATYLALLREILKRAWPAYVRGHPDTSGPCHSCAFNPGTDTWPGFEKTAMGLMEAIQKAQPFYCHEHLPTQANGEWFYDPTLPPPSRCRGWEAIAAHPETKHAAFAAAKCVGHPPPRARNRVPLATPEPPR